MADLAVALHAMYCNFVREHSKLRTSPAMAASVADKLWDVKDIVALVAADEAKTVPAKQLFRRRRRSLHHTGRGPICDLGRRNADRPRRRHDYRRRSARTPTRPYRRSPASRVIDWYGGTLVSRLNDKRTGAIIAVMQRLHEDDLAGHLLRQGGWDHLDMPAIAFEDEDDRPRSRQDPSARIGDMLSIPSARAERRLRRSRRKSAACCSRPNTSSGRSRSRAISSAALGSRPTGRLSCPPPPSQQRSFKAGMSP